MTKLKSASGGGSGGTPGLTQEEIEDIVAALLVAGPGISVSYDDPGNAITISLTTMGSVAGSGRKTVTTPGTAVAFFTSTACVRVIATAETDNTNLVVVGASDVVAALATRKGVPLSPGQTESFYVSNLANIYLDALVATEGVTFVWEA